LHRHQKTPLHLALFISLSRCKKKQKKRTVSSLWLPPLLASSAKIVLRRKSQRSNVSWAISASRVVFGGDIQHRDLVVVRLEKCRESILQQYSSYSPLLRLPFFSLGLDAGFGVQLSPLPFGCGCHPWCVCNCPRDNLTNMSYTGPRLFLRMSSTGRGSSCRR